MKAIVSIPCETRCFPDLQSATTFALLYEKSKPVDFDSGVNKYVESFTFTRNNSLGAEVRSVRDDLIDPRLFALKALEPLHTKVKAK
jgi:hypothetical protein